MNLDQAKQKIIDYLNDTQTDIRTIKQYRYTDTHLFFGHLTTEHTIKINGINIKIDNEELTQ